MKKSVLFLATVLFLIGCPEGEGKNIDVAPRITLIGPSEVFFNVDDIYIEYGYTATDVDGNDVSSLVRRDTSTLNMGKEGSYQISYVAVDRKGVKSDAVYRTVNVGNAFAPEITISGSNPLLLKLNGEFTQPSATAMAYDGTDLSDLIQVNAESVDTTKVGTYIVSYTVTDSSGVTGTAQLYVYVMESSSPRIIVEGVGAIADNPYPLQVQGASASDETVKSYLNKALPYFQAYDLEDGDISYKVTVSEDEVYNNLISALKADSASDNTPKALTLTVSDSSGNTPSPLPVFYVTVVTDTTPPVITLADDQPMYTIEIDAWNDNTKAWNELFQKLGATIIDDSMEEYTPKPFTPNTPIDGISEHGIDDTALRAALTMNGDRDQFLANYDYNNATAPLNYKKVTLWAKDMAGNSVTKEITVYLTDTTAPEIIKSNITIPFGISAVSSSHQLRWQDNSGAEGSCSGLDLAAIDNALTEGSFNVTFTAMHPNNPSKSSTLTYPVRVGSPLLSPSGGSWVNNNLLAQAGVNYNFLTKASDYTGNDGKGVAKNLKPITPIGWSFATPRDGSSGEWYWTSLFSSGHGPINAVSAADPNNDCIVCCGVLYPSSAPTIGAYLTCGNIAVGAASTMIRNVNVAISTTANVTLYNGVTYEIGYDAADFKTSGSALGDTGGARYLDVARTAGTGTFGGQTIYSVSHTAAVKTNKDTWAYEHMGSVGNYSGSEWENQSGQTTISGGNITSVSLLYSILDPGNSADYGSLVTNFRICPVKWKGKQDKTKPDSPIGYWNYDTSSGAVTWSEN